MNDTPPQHSGSRWEPGASGEPTVPLGARPAGAPLPPAVPGRPAWPAPGPVQTERDRHRRGRPLLLVAVLAVLTLLTTGGWFALSALQRHGDDPVAGISQGPFAGSDQGHRDGDQQGLPPRDRTGIDRDSDGDGGRQFDGGDDDGDDDGGAGVSGQRQTSGNGGDDA